MHSRTLPYMLLVPVAPSTKRRVRVGDAFVFRPGRAPLFWGRVIQDQFENPRFRGHLVYLYDVSTSDAKEVPWNLLTPEKLLVPH